MRIFVIGLALVVVSAAFYFLRETPQAEVRAHARMSVEAGETLESLRGQVRSLESRLRSVEATQDEASELRGAEIGQIALSEERESDIPPANSATDFASVEEKFLAESADSKWQAEASDLIAHTQTTDALRGTVLRGLACRQSMCRMEGTHADQESLDRFVTVGPSEMQYAGHIRVHVSPNLDGTLSSVVHFTRRGEVIY